MLLLLVPSVLLAAAPPIRLRAAPDGTSLQLDRLPLAAPAKLEDATYEDESILTVQLFPSDSFSKPLPILTLPLRFEPGQVGDVPAVWTHQSRAVAFILPCHVSRQDSAARLFIFCVSERRLQPVALPDITTHLTRDHHNFAFLSIQFTGDGCFGWIGEELLVVPFSGSCLTNGDVGGSESREISGHAVFYLDANGNATIREILSLHIQG